MPDTKMAESTGAVCPRRLTMPAPEDASKTATVVSALPEAMNADGEGEAAIQVTAAECAAMWTVEEGEELDEGRRKMRMAPSA
jgi:hypothetical protein